MKEIKYQVGDYVKFNDEGFDCVGKIVEKDNINCLIELPKEFHGYGHTGSAKYGNKYKDNNYWFVGCRDIECKVEKPESEDANEETKVARFKVGDKVKVRSDLVVNEEYGYLAWLGGSMDKLAGKVLTIKKVYKEGCYDFEETMFALSEEMIECKVDEEEIEMKETKYKIGDCVKFNRSGLSGVGKIIEVNSGFFNDEYLLELSKELHGKGHDGNGVSKGKYKGDNYWFVNSASIECKVDGLEFNGTHEDEFIEPASEEFEVKDQFLYDHKVKTNGNIAFNKVKMLTLCFVKYNHWGKVYTFINPTGKVLKEGTKVLVDSAGSDNVAYVVASAKVQAKHVDGLVFAMTGKKGLELKNVLGVYETKTEIKEIEVLDKYED